MGNNINRVLRGTRPEIRELLLTAHHQGYTVTRTRKHHFRISAPSDPRVVHAAGTPSELRGMRNLRSKLRGIGVIIDH